MTSMSRRRMMQIAAGSLAGSLIGTSFPLTRAAGAEAVRLTVTSRIIDVYGKPARVYGILQPNGTAGLLADGAGDFRVALDNALDDPTLVHWHGLTPPSEQDGVPGLSQPPLDAAAAHDYAFVNRRTGTHWMHSHLGLQEQQLLAAPLIVRDTAEAGLDEQDVVILLHDFSFRSPEEIYDELRTGAGMAMSHAMEPADDDTAQMHDGHGETMPETMGGMDHGESMDMDRDMSGDAALQMDTTGGMADMVHANDVEYDAYLANDRTLADPEIVRVDPGGRLRLRIINAAAATNFLIDLGALQGELIAVDGDAVAPIRGSRFELAIAQRVDIRLGLPADQGAYPILARREEGTEQTGVVLATKDGMIHHLSDHAETRTPLFGLTLERQLAALGPLPARSAERAETLDITGSHMGYRWGFNGKVYDPNDPIRVAEGERVELVLRNMTGMHHPIHLHGHHFQVVAIDGERFSGAVRDTVLVPPSRSVTIAFDADNPGHWALHCHQLYHMVAGMMTSILYEGYRPT